jgi:hypothetical protein
MAIILEEERPQTNWVAILGGFVIVVLIFIACYYVFFKKPEIIDVVVPADLEQVSLLAKVQKLDPQAIVNSSNFKMLRDYAPPLVLPPAGRANPFRP